MSGRYQVKFVNGKIAVERPPVSQNTDEKLKGSIQRNDSKIKFIPESIDLPFDEFFASFTGKIRDMRLTKKQTNQVFSLLEEFVHANMKLCGRFFEKSEIRNTDVIKILSKTQTYTTNKINSFKSDYLRNKILNENPYYVAPVEKAMGLAWQTKYTVGFDLLDHQIKQTTFHVVPIAGTLKSLFLNPNFKGKFIEHNNNRHKCIDGVFEDYCCGNVCRSDGFFQRKNTVVIQFGVDEFDVCCGLKTKATKHKIFAIYFKIRNMPIKYSSKLDNIYLVALCKSANFKQTGCGEEDVFGEVARELESLEAEGLVVANDFHIKVGLFDVCGDNLGLNISYGFAASFNAEYYCRLCSCTKDEAQTTTTENTLKRRTVMQYEHQLERLSANPNLSLKETEGIQKDCLLNRLKHFHVISLPVVDIMHDIFEGVIPAFLIQFFKYCIVMKIATEADLIRLIRDYNYGQLNSTNKPSKLCLDRKNLGQNAIQSYCIITNLPFMLANKKHQLERVWKTMVSLLKCIQIVVSYKITEYDIQQFEINKELVMSTMLNVFHTKLKPKLHNFNHYKHVIREMGPLRLMWMMRYESKHKFFTDAVKKTNNFINITKTLAEIHQAYISTKLHSYNDEIDSAAKKYPLSKDTNYSIYRSILDQITQFDINASSALQFLKYNGNVYRRGIMVTFQNKISEIIYVLHCNSEYFLVCHIHDVIQFEESLNSFEIKKSDNVFECFQVFNVKQLEINACFEKKFAQNSIFIFAESLELFKSLSLNIS